MEDIPERITFLQGKGEESLAWILRKYRIEEPVREIDRPVYLAHGPASDGVTGAPRTEASDGQSGLILQEAELDEAGDEVWRPGR